MLATICIILGIIAFLLMEHALAFWLVFVPLAILFVITAVGLVRKGRGAMGSIMTLLFIFILAIVVLLIICS